MHYFFLTNCNKSDVSGFIAVWLARACFAKMCAADVARSSTKPRVELAAASTSTMLAVSLRHSCNLKQTTRKLCDIADYRTTPRYHVGNPTCFPLTQSQPDRSVAKWAGAAVATGKIIISTGPSRKKGIPPGYPTCDVLSPT
jgi:hypothetical protein